MDRLNASWDFISKQICSAILLATLAVPALAPGARANTETAIKGGTPFKTTKIIGYTSYIFANDRLYMQEKAMFTTEGEADMAKLALLLQDAARHPVSIKVHSDGLGFASYNLKLSQQRADLIKSWLSERVAFVPDALTAEGMGGSHPIDANLLKGKDNPLGRQHNRRTEIVVNTNQILETPAVEVVESEQSAKKKDELSAEDRRKLPPELQSMHQEFDMGDESNKRQDGAENNQSGSENMQGDAQDRAFNPDGEFAQDANAVEGESKKDVTADGKRKMHEPTAAEKKKMQEELEWNRNEFGLFLKNER